MSKKKTKEEENAIARSINIMRNNGSIASSTEALTCIDWVSSWFPGMFEELVKKNVIKIRNNNNNNNDDKTLCFSMHNNISRGGRGPSYNLKGVSEKSIIFCFCDASSFMDINLDIEFSVTTLGDVFILAACSYISYKKKQAGEPEFPRNVITHTGIVKMNLLDITEGKTKGDRDRAKRKFTDVVKPCIEILEMK